MGTKSKIKTQMLRDDYPHRDAYHAEFCHV